jgi:hypothetical protein
MNDYGSFRRHLSAVPLELFMFGAAFIMLAMHDTLHVATSLFTFLVSFLPLLLEWWWKVRLPAWTHFTYVLFVFASMFCGEVLHLYGKILWWDDLMHVSSGILMGLAVVLWLQLASKRGADLPYWARILLVITIVVTVAALWEFVEFGSDQLFGTKSQDNGSLVDTMMDMIDASAGAAITASFYVYYLKTKQGLLLPIIRHFLRLNT